LPTLAALFLHQVSKQTSSWEGQSSWKPPDRRRLNQNCFAIAQSTEMAWRCK
jgi:hypothetical protein